MSDFNFNCYTTSRSVYSIQEYVGEDLYICISMMNSLQPILFVMNPKVGHNVPIILPDLNVYLISQYTGEEMKNERILQKNYHMIFPQENYIVKYKGNTVFKLNRFRGWDISFEE